ncbi:MAG: hypothetical protein R3B89_25585 [Polyangiaceae bacterium]
MTEPESDVVTRRGETLSEDEPTASSSLHVSVELEEPVPATPRSVAVPVGEETTTTLLSAPTPASSFEVETEDRLTRLELELSLLRSRLESLEAQKRLVEESEGSAGSGASEPAGDLALGAKQWRLVLLWLLGMSLLAAYGLLK